MKPFMVKPEIKTDGADERLRQRRSKCKWKTIIAAGM